MNFRGQKILVAGASGFLGGAVARRLLASGALVRGTYFSRPPAAAIAGLDWRHADLRDGDACAAVCADIDMVVMCAARTAGAAVIATTPLVHVTPNVVMNARMLEAAHRAGVRRFLFVSSGAAYPDLGAAHALREADMFAADPPPVYFAAGWMKRYAEILCRTYAQTIAERPMPCVVVRPSNVYGPGDKWDFATSHVTAAQVRRVIERQAPIEVWGDGEDVRDLIYIDDFVDGLLRALATPLAFLTVNIAAGVGYSVRQILGAAIAADGYEGAVLRFDPAKPRTLGRRLFDVTFARQALGFSATTTLDAGISRTIDWYRATHGLPRPAGAAAAA